MDLVNSVTQNSNNKNVTMENQPPIYNDHNSSGVQLSATATNMRAPSSSDLSGYPDVVSASNARSQLPDYLRAIGTDPKKFWPKKYRFTREKTPGQYNPLSIAQRNFYESNGYLIIDGCNSQKLIDAIKAQHARGPTRDLRQVDRLLDKLVMKNTKLLQYVKCFCDERAMLMTSRLVESFQQSAGEVAGGGTGQSQRQRLVRDWIYLPFRPIDKVVCAITALEPLDNVIFVAPGTHRVGQCTITSSPKESSRAPAAFEASRDTTKELFECSPKNLSSLVENSTKGLKYLDLKQGQTLFYHPGLVHGFCDDLVNFERRQLASIAYYAAADCEYVELSRQKNDDEQSAAEPPIGLAHFGKENPSDYNSWLNRPRLFQDFKASL